MIYTLSDVPGLLWLAIGLMLTGFGCYIAGLWIAIKTGSEYALLFVPVGMILNIFSFAISFSFLVVW